MFKLCEKYEINGNILKFDYIRYISSEISTRNTANSLIYIIIPKEDSVISLLKSYIGLNFDVLHADSGDRYTNGDNIGLGILGPVASFSKYKLTTSIGKHIEEISIAHIVSLVYQLLTSSRGSDDLSIGFHRDRYRRQREITNSKNM